MKGEIRILIADDHPVLRQGLRQAIERDARLRVVGEASDGEEALARIEELRPDVAVLDIEMPERTGFEVARAARARRLQVEIIFLTMHKDEETFNASLDAGARGYVLKDSAVTDIIGGIKAVAEGRHFISPAISSYLVNRGRRAESLKRSRPGLDDLTPTERRIIRLIAENKTSREIASELFISHRTVENHRANICNKLDIHGSHALLRFALEHKSELS